MLMLLRRLGLSLLLLALIESMACGASSAGFQLPPAEIVRYVDAQPNPPAVAIASPGGRWIAIGNLQDRPSIKELESPTINLAGVHVDEETNATVGTVTWQSLVGLSVYNTVNGRKVNLPALPDFVGKPLWSPAGDRFALLHRQGQLVELWVVDVEKHNIRRIEGIHLNAAQMSVSSTAQTYEPLPCDWYPDGKRILCLTIPADRARPPADSDATLPNVRDTSDPDAHVRAAQPGEDQLLKSEHDERLFDYVMTAQPVIVDVDAGTYRNVGMPGIYTTLTVSPDGNYILAVRTVRPYSHVLRWHSFSTIAEVLDANGNAVQVISHHGVKTSRLMQFGNIESGPRDFSWRPTAAATLTFYEAPDDGDAVRSAEYRDSLMLLPKPFNGKPIQVFRSKGRMGISPARALWGSNGLLVLGEYDWNQRQRRVWSINIDAHRRSPILLQDCLWQSDAGVGVHDCAGELQAKLTSRTGRGVEIDQYVPSATLMQSGDWVYLRGLVQSERGAFPYLDRLNTRDGRRERLFSAKPGTYEAVLSILDDNARMLLTSYETPKTPPNFRLLDLSRHTSVELTHFRDPLPELQRDRTETVDYSRADGIKLHGVLHLPVNYRSGDRAPTIVSGYPTLLGDVSPPPASNRFMAGPRYFNDPLALVTQGYAVFEADMALTGTNTEVMDSINQQLAADAEAAVQKLIALGIADPARIGVTGHSYGGFMVANLLENTHLFAAGVAFSGVYNTMLEPEGGQYETRSYWQAPEAYERVSPFVHADRISAPLLLVHGESDSNGGAFPRQSTEMFDALQFLGKRARLVMYPFEEHVFRAKETTLDSQWEMLNWFDTYVRRSK